ncbi:MAG: hypothetical protein EOP09_03585 [Proteobacteria bacterium]|nr:MAG: hypothetical protein EOP09_03585 [Pseudomonadota bacterium]
MNCSTQSTKIILFSKTIYNFANHAKDFLETILADEFLSDSLLKWELLQPRLKEWREEFPELRAPRRLLVERTLNLLGKQAIRNYVASVFILKLSDQLPKKSGDRLRIQPNDQVKFAIQAEQFVEHQGLPEAGLAFLAGYHFDLLRASLFIAKAPREALTFLDREWEDGLKRAHYASLLGTTTQSIAQGEWLFPVTMLIRLGRMLQVARSPKEQGSRSVSQWLKEQEKGWISPYLERAKENTLQEVSEVEWSALIVSVFELLPELSEALLLRERPYLLDSKNLKLLTLFEIIQQCDWNFPEPKREFRGNIPKNVRDQMQKKIRG